jgi:hypothetical protein
MYDVSYVSDLTKGKTKELNWIESYDTNFVYTYKII